jgi:hypothetical protein
MGSILRNAELADFDYFSDRRFVLARKSTANDGNRTRCCKRSKSLIPGYNVVQSIELISQTQYSFEYSITSCR